MPCIFSLHDLMSPTANFRMSFIPCQSNAAVGVLLRCPEVTKIAFGSRWLRRSIWRRSYWVLLSVRQMCGHRFAQCPHSKLRKSAACDKCVLSSAKRTPCVYTAHDIRRARRHRINANVCLQHITEQDWTDLTCNKSTQLLDDAFVGHACRRHDLIGCSETRTVGAQRVLNACTLVRMWSPRTPDRELAFSLVQFTCCEQTLMHMISEQNSA